VKEKSTIHHRRSPRLKDYDYSQEGAYFITICLNRRANVFGIIAGGEMNLNNVGQIIEKWWKKLPEKFPGVQIDYYVMMPNQFHGIISVVGGDPRVAPNTGTRTGVPLPKIIQWFKTMTSNEYIKWKKRNNISSLTGGLWQRNYYEHVIRNEEDLYNTRKYIIQNPLKWDLDTENPENSP
jgi:putative transposase